jgi:hypothetical protein
LLVAVAFVASAALHDGAITTLTALAGCVLILFAFLGARLESFGPKGVTLRELVDRAAAKLERTATDSLTASDDASAVVTRYGSGHAAAAIRAAKSPEQLIDTLVDIIEHPAPESASARMERIREDEAAKRRARSFGRINPE